MVVVHPKACFGKASVFWEARCDVLFYRVNIFANGLVEIPFTSGDTADGFHCNEDTVVISMFLEIG